LQIESRSAPHSLFTPSNDVLVLGLREPAVSKLRYLRSAFERLPVLCEASIQPIVPVGVPLILFEFVNPVGKLPKRASGSRVGK
ncbi:MAG: hypothetical protein ACLFNI_11635, partial [Natronomonas sp.]